MECGDDLIIARAEDTISDAVPKTFLRFLDF